MDFAKLSAVLTEGSDFLLLLLFAELLPLLELCLLGSEFSEAALVVVFLLFLQHDVDRSLGHFKMGSIRKVIVGHDIVLSEALVDLCSKVERAVWTSRPTLEGVELIYVLYQTKVKVSL